jgi:hypothetical protein
MSFSEIMASFSFVCRCAFSFACGFAYNALVAIVGPLTRGETTSIAVCILLVFLIFFVLFACHGRRVLYIVVGDVIVKKKDARGRLAFSEHGWRSLLVWPNRIKIAVSISLG